jgi:hypothetical protein
MPSIRAKIRGTSRIGFRGFDVLASVEFDGEFRLPADQIDDEGRFDELSGECRAITRDPLPNGEFRGRGIVAQFACASGQARIDTAQHAASVHWLRFAR